MTSLIELQFMTMREPLEMVFLNLLSDSVLFELLLTLIMMKRVQTGLGHAHELIEVQIHSVK